MAVGRRVPPGVLVVLALLLALLGPGCGDAGGVVPAAGPGVAAPEAGANQVTLQAEGPFPLARPSVVAASLRGIKQTSSLLQRDASDYVPEYCQHAIPAAPRATFSPSWIAGSSSFDTVSYAVYRFDLTGRTGALGITTEWNHAPGDYKLLWLGLSNWQRDRWDWRSGSPAGTVDTGLAGMAQYKHSTTGELYVAVVLLGTNSAQLAQVRVGCSQQGDWCMYRRQPGHNTQSCYTGPDYPTLKWNSSSFGLHHNSLPVFDAAGVLYFSDYLLEHFALYAYSPSGVQQWVCSLNTPDLSAISTAAVGPDGAIYLAQANGKLYAVSPSGVLKWTSTAPFGFGAGAAAQPVVDGQGVIYLTVNDTASSQGYIYARNPDGALRWTTVLSGLSTNPALGPDGILYAGGGDYKLHAISSAGAELWTYDAGAPVLVDPVVGEDGLIYAISSTLNTLVVVDSGGQLLWSAVLPAPVERAPAVARDGAVYVPCTDGFVYKYGADGAPRWSYYVAGKSGVALDAQGAVYVASSDSRLYALTADGALKWWYEQPLQLLEYPVFGEDGTVYVLTDARELCALGPGGTGAHHTASGYVRDSGGAGLPGVSVSITGQEPALTDTAGHWVKPGLPAGVYIAAAQKVGYAFTPGMRQFDVTDADVVLADFTGAVAQAAEWPMHGKNRAHTRRSPHTGPATPVVRWSDTAKIGACHLDPAIGGDGVVYFGNETGGIYAYNPDGSLRWLRSDNFDGGNGVALGQDGSVYASLLGAENTRILRAFTPGGEFKWSFGLNWVVCGIPLIGDDGAIFLNGGNAQYDPYTFCKLNPDGTVAQRRTGFDNGNGLAVNGAGVVYAFQLDGEGCSVCAMTPQGALLWAYPVAMNGYMLNSTWIALDDDGTVYACYASSIYALTPAGLLKWRYDSGSPVVYPPAVGLNHTLYLAQASMNSVGTDKVFALDGNGGVVWEFTAPDTVFECSPTLDAYRTTYLGGNTVFTTENGVEYHYKVFAINAVGGLKWTFDGVSGRVSGIAIGADGTLYCGDYRGNVFALGPGTP